LILNLSSPSLPAGGSRVHILIRTAIAALAVLPLASAAAQEPVTAAPELPAFEAVEAAQVLLDAEAPGEIRKGPGKTLLEQNMVYAGDAALDLSLPERKIFLDRHGMENRAPLFLAHHLRRDLLGGMTHLGWVFCAINTRMFKGQAVDCLRDLDGDRRFESIASFEPANPTSLTLTFAPIDPVPYHLVMASRSPPKRGQLAGAGRLSIEYDFDPARGLLLFRARARTSFYGLGVNYPLEPVIEVDPKSLPSEIELAGARLRLLAWDGKLLTAAVDRMMTRNPVLLVAPPGRGGRMPLGKMKGHRLMIVDAPLPAD
jgi:hypothetical protein